MKILTGEQIKQADIATIQNEPVTSMDLMERASEAMAREICTIVNEDDDLLFFTGKGNNGGDGLAMARILSNAGFSCRVVQLYKADELSRDCLFNLERLPETVEILGLQEAIQVYGNTVIIDAILGTGLKGEVSGVAIQAIGDINASGAKVISIDIPSGMNTEFENDPRSIVHADYTLTVEFPKLAMLLPEAGECAGEMRIVQIDLDEQFISEAQTPYRFVTEEIIMPLLKVRGKFSHKGDFGHALLVCGSADMLGAAVLSASGALRSGCGLVTVHVPGSVAHAMFASAPSALVSRDNNDSFSSLPANLEKYSGCGCGCGLGTSDDTVSALERLLREFREPMVLDADALNIIAANPPFRSLIPHGSVLTPHPGEFKRLVGGWENENDKLIKLLGLSAELKSTVLLKGAYTAVCTHDGIIYFNPTGTPGMAKGGSGDVLTGLIAGLMARGYSGEEAAILGAYLHGRAGEKAAGYYGVESMNSSDIPDFIAEAFLEFEKETAE